MDVQHLGMTGYKAADWLRGRHAIAVELADHRRVMAAVSHADTDASIDRTLAALRDMVGRFGSGGRFTRPSRPVPGLADLRTEQVMTLVVPGERITAEIADYLKTGSAQGIYVEGCADQSLSTLRVVADA